MLGDMVRTEVMASSRKPVLWKGAVVDLRGEPIPNGIVFPTSTNSIAFTDLRYGVRYQKSKYEWKTDKPFLLRADILGLESVYRFADYAELERDAEKDVRIRFILENTNLSPELLRIAESFQRRDCPLAFDVVGYESKLRKRMDEMGWERQPASVFINDEMAMMDEAAIADFEKADARERSAAGCARKRRSEANHARKEGAERCGRIGLCRQ